MALTAVWRAGVKLGDSVLVCGAGPIGLTVMLCANAAGAQNIVITDIDEKRLKFAKALMAGKGGHVRAILVGKESPEELAKKITEIAGGEIDVGIECTGVESSLATAIHASKFGGSVFVVGVGKDEMNIPFMILSVKEVDLRFQYRYANTWPTAIRLLESGAVKEIRRLVTHRFKLEEAVKAFEAVGHGSVKVMIQDS